jgi:hypothetical protein
MPPTCFFQLLWHCLLYSTVLMFSNVVVPVYPHFSLTLSLNVTHIIDFRNLMWDVHIRSLSWFRCSKARCVHPWLCSWSHILLKVSYFWIFPFLYFMFWYLASQICEGIEFFSFSTDNNSSVLPWFPYVSRTEYQASDALPTIGILLMTFLNIKLFI